VGLKAGWGFGVAITACILSYAIWTALYRAGIARTPMTILENNCMQSTASSAGYSTGGTLISAFAAWMLINRTAMPLGEMLAWVFLLSVLGVTMAIPMKRQMINVEQLRFPSGIAAAETLRALHSVGAQGLRVCWSMLLGSVTAWMIFVPWLQRRGVIEGAGYGALVQWTLWGGVACMVSASLLAFALQWRTALRALTDLGAMVGAGRRAAAGDPVAALEAPASWFVGGQLVGLLGLAWLGHRAFGMPYWQTAVAVVLSFALALVACRVTGETDTTPVGAMGKITQLAFGVLSPGNMNVNLMSANVTAAAAASSADLLTDLKSGYLLGANPRQQ